jgi:nucleoside-diphosphate-sugar epimerase
VSKEPQPDKPVAVITGVGGTLGPILAHHLNQRGYSIRGFDCKHPEVDILPAECHLFLGDIIDQKLLTLAFRGADFVFHLAAKLHIPDPSFELKEDYKRVNVDGTRSVVQAALSAGVKRLVFFSTINVYGSSQPGQLLDESSPLNPDSFYAESKALAEEVVSMGIPSVILRLAAVYGPRMKGNYVRLVNAIRRNRFVPIGNGLNRRTLVYQQDVAAAALLAAEHPAAKGQIYNVTDGTVHTLREIQDAVARAIGKRPQRLFVPASAARLLAAALEYSFRLLGKRCPIDGGTIDKLLEDMAVSGERIQRKLGFRPQFDLSAGWKEAIRFL